jgi:drug/metabolite transporter superfamily protein YnfA
MEFATTSNAGRYTTNYLNRISAMCMICLLPRASEAEFTKMLAPFPTRNFPMRYGISMVLLLLAAVLEAGGDAFMRSGIHSPTMARRSLFFLVGGLVLTAYSYTVNAPPWNFGRLLGVYVACFFVVAQVIAWLAFAQKPSTSVLLGGLFIIAGGLIVSLGK